MQVYLAQNKNFCLSDLRVSPASSPGNARVAVGQSALKLKPAKIKYVFQERRNPGLREKVAQLLQNGNQEHELRVELSNVPSAPPGESGGEELQLQLLQVKVLGDILPNFYSVFGNQLRLTVTMAKASISERVRYNRPPENPSHHTLHRVRLFPTQQPWDYAAAQWSWQSLMDDGLNWQGGHQRQGPSQNPVNLKKSVGPTGSPAEKLYMTKAMRMVNQPGIAANFCDTIEFPENWLHFWLDDPTKYNFIAEITMILSLVDDDTAGLEYGSALAVNRKLLQDEIRTDLEIVTSEGQVVKCHSGFLVAQSEVFKGMLDSSKEMEEATTNRICMDDMSTECVKALLTYLYYRDLESARNHSGVAVELLKAGRKYLIENLEHEVKNILMCMPNKWFDVDGTLALVFFAGRVDQHADLKNKAIQVLRSKSDAVKASAFYQTMFQENPAAAIEIANAFLDNK